jgi:hypothetical protein
MGVALRFKPSLDPKIFNHTSYAHACHKKSFAFVHLLGTRIVRDRTVTAEARVLIVHSTQYCSRRAICEDSVRPYLSKLFSIQRNRPEIRAIDGFGGSTSEGENFRGKRTDWPQPRF